MLIMRGWISRWGGLISAAMLVTAGVAVLGAWNSQSIRMLSVNSGSMEPLVAKGDAVLVRKVDPLEIHKGDLVSYRSLEDSAVIITHRVIEVDALTGRLITKGDANTKADPTIHGIRVIGRVQHIVPGMGYYINALHTWVGLTVVVYAPTAMLVASELRRLARHYLQPTYVLYRRHYSS